MEFATQIFDKLVAMFIKIKQLSFISWAFATIIGFFEYYKEVIGYPSDVVGLIIFLVISDFVTRIVAQLVLANKTFNCKSKLTVVYFIKLVLYAFEIKVISSRKFYAGFFSKVISYSVLLIIAHSVSHLVIPLLGYIPAVIYGGLIIYDIISNLENLSEIGFSQAKGLLKIFKRKQEEFEEQIPTEDLKKDKY